MIRILQSDITTLSVDAIVNAANERMLGGGGVDGAIHRAAGRELYEACLAVPEVRPGVRCPTGEARITPGYRLPARWVIHTADHACRSVAFPCISTGVYGYPLEPAARIAIREVREFLSHAEPRSRGEEEMEVVFCCFSERDAAVYELFLYSNPEKGAV